jgi:hypothetical protein
MSPVPNRPVPRGSGASPRPGRRPAATRTVLLGYLLRRRADDRVCQIVARCESSRLSGFLTHLDAEERVLLAALFARMPVASGVARIGEAVLRELFGALGLPELRRVAAEATPAGLASVVPFLSRRVAADARKAGILPHDDPAPRPRVEAAFRLRRLFVT